MNVALRVHRPQDVDPHTLRGRDRRTAVAAVRSYGSSRAGSVPYPACGPVRTPTTAAPPNGSPPPPPYAVFAGCSSGRSVRARRRMRPSGDVPEKNPYLARGPRRERDRGRRDVGRRGRRRCRAGPPGAVRRLRTHRHLPGLPEPSGRGGPGHRDRRGDICGQRGRAHPRPHRRRRPAHRLPRHQRPRRPARPRHAVAGPARGRRGRADLGVGGGAVRPGRRGHQRLPRRAVRTARRHLAARPGAGGEPRPRWPARLHRGQ